MFEILLITGTYFTGMIITAFVGGKLDRRFIGDRTAYYSDPVNPFEIFTTIGVFIWPITLPIYLGIPLSIGIWKYGISGPVRVFQYIYKLGRGDEPQIKLLGSHSKALARRIGR